jgi:phosphate transport system substrate-binding protein
MVLVTVLTVDLWRHRTFGPSEHILLSLSGSTSLGDELVPDLAEAFLRDELGAVKTGFEIKGRDAKGHPYLHVWGKVPGKSALQVIRIYAAGSGAAFDCLAARSGPNYCDIGMSSRPINDRDRRINPALRSLGGHTTEHVVALDGIAIIVNPSNPVSRLSIPQLRAIYSGEIRNWRQVGGHDAPIELYGRDQNSGTLEVFTDRVMGRDPQGRLKQAKVPADHQIGDSSFMVDAVTRSSDAIGYVSSPLIRDAKALMISDGNGPAIRPTQLSVVTEDYPICRRLLMYDRNSPDTVMNAFIRFVIYKPGQALVEKTPFVELTPRIFAVVPPPGSPAAYKKIAMQYSRIGLSFHFSSEQIVSGKDAKSELDNLADINILRLQTFLSQHGGMGGDILLIGFADETEAGTASEQLARQRAESVAISLEAIGVLVPPENIKDFGADLAVASNNTPEGRSRNRRVEVWVRKGLFQARRG